MYVKFHCLPIEIPRNIISFNILFVSNIFFHNPQINVLASNGLVWCFSQLYLYLQRVIQGLGNYSRIHYFQGCVGSFGHLWIGFVLIASKLFGFMVFFSVMVCTFFSFFSFLVFGKKVMSGCLNLVTSLCLAIMHHNCANTLWKYFFS